MVEHWNGVLKWNGALEWSAGMECWNGVLEWSAGMEVLWCSKGYVPGNSISSMGFTKVLLLFSLRISMVI
jgi:hypothetical protein